MAYLGQGAEGNFTWTIANLERNTADGCLSKIYRV